MTKFHAKCQPSAKASPPLMTTLSAAAIPPMVRLRSASAFEPGERMCINAKSRDSATAAKQRGARRRAEVRLAGRGGRVQQPAAQLQLLVDGDPQVEEYIPQDVKRPALALAYHLERVGRRYPAEAPLDRKERDDARRARENAERRVDGRSTIQPQAEVGQRSLVQEAAHADQRDCRRQPRAQSYRRLPQPHRAAHVVEEEGLFAAASELEPSGRQVLGPRPLDRRVIVLHLVC